MHIDYDNYHPDYDSPYFPQLTHEQLMQCIKQFQISDVSRFTYNLRRIYQDWEYEKDEPQLVPPPGELRKELKARIKEAEKFKENLNVIYIPGTPQLSWEVDTHIKRLEIALEDAKSKSKPTRKRGPEFQLFRRLGSLYKALTGKHPADDLKQDRGGVYGYTGPFMEFIHITAKPLSIFLENKGKTVYSAAKSLKQ